MPTSIKRQAIMENLLTALAAIDGTGSYYTDLDGHIFEHRTSIVDQSELPALIVSDTSTTRIEEEVKGGYNQFVLGVDVNIQALLAYSSSNAQAARKIIMDVFRALKANETLSNKAINIQYLSDELLYEQAQNKDKVVAGAVIRIRIIYATNRFEES